MSLKAWREGLGLNQRDAASVFGISQSCWSKIELGIRAPRKDLARRLIAVTGVPADILMGIAS